MASEDLRKDHGQDGEQFGPVKLTEEEMRVLRECRVNSLYLRGLPLGLLSALGTRYLAKNHFPHLGRWAGFYYTVSFGLGLAVGVGSYKDRCFSKIMSLKDSRLADQVRSFKRRAAGLSGDSTSTEFDMTENVGGQESDSTSQQSGFPSLQQQDSNSPMGNWKQSFSNTVGNLHDRNENNQNEEEHRKGSTYEELRRMHRSRLTEGPRRVPNSANHDRDEVEHQDSSKYDPDATYDKRETYSTGLTWDSDLQRKGPDEGLKSPSQNKGTWPQKSREIKKKNMYGDDME